MIGGQNGGVSFEFRLFAYSLMQPNLGRLGRFRRGRESRGQPPGAFPTLRVWKRVRAWFDRWQPAKLTELTEQTNRRNSEGETKQESLILVKRVDNHLGNLFYPISSQSAFGSCGIAEKDRVFLAKAHPIFLISGINYRAESSIPREVTI